MSQAAACVRLDGDQSESVIIQWREGKTHGDVLQAEDWASRDGGDKTRQPRCIADACSECGCIWVRGPSSPAPISDGAAEALRGNTSVATSRARD